jgi:hypothetical protein
MEKWKKDKESMTEKRNLRELLWFQTGGALNFIIAAPHCGNSIRLECGNFNQCLDSPNFSQLYSMLFEPWNDLLS